MAENQTRSDVDVCPYWMAGLLDNPLRRLLHNPEKILAEFMHEGQTALDLGCGPGYFTMAMARLTASGSTSPSLSKTAPCRRTKFTPYFASNRAVAPSATRSPPSCGGPFTAQKRTG